MSAGWLTSRLDVLPRVWQRASPRLSAPPEREPVIADYHKQSGSIRCYLFLSSLHLLPASHWRLGSGPVTKDGLCLCTSACCQRPSCLSLSVTSAERGPPFLPRLPAGTGRPCLFLFRALRPKRRSRSAARDSNAAAPTRETEQHAPACATRFSKVRPPSGNEATHTSRSGSPNFAGTCRFPSQTSAVLSRSHAAC